ncbi:MAG: hypothetical protein JXB04_13350 [Kiritimatiellae bacterium]|nr:hypothetical protein [Kiritimatiellia bacterium]
MRRPVITASGRSARRPTLLLPVCLLAAAFAAGGEAPAPSAPRDNRAAVRELNEEHLGLHAEDPDVMVRPGLLADRRGKWVRLWGEAIGVNPHDPVEFFLIAENSGKDYEALAFSFARPLALHRALEFIGLHPGQPVDYDRMRLWPKAERVRMTFEWTDRDGELQRAAPEELIVDTRTRRTLPVMGFAFTGSLWVEDDGDSTQKVYAAEVYDPLAIASAYNEPLCVLDVPRRAVDGQVYGYQKANPDRLLPKGALLSIRLEPEYKDGRTRVADLTLKVSPRKGAHGRSLPEMLFALETAAGQSAARGNGLKHILAAFGRLTKDGRDPFVSVAPGRDLPLEGVRALYDFLSGIATDNGIRLEPPAAGHLFYRAFLPDESLRDRANRPSQPWELRLALSNGVPAGELVRITEIWKPEKETPEIETAPEPVADPAALEASLAAQPPDIPILLIFAPGEMHYGVLMEFLGPALPRFPTVYVFLTDPTDPSDPSDHPR